MNICRTTRIQHGNCVVPYHRVAMIVAAGRGRGGGGVHFILTSNPDDFL